MEYYFWGAGAAAAAVSYILLIRPLNRKAARTAVYGAALIISLFAMDFILGRLSQFITESTGIDYKINYSFYLTLVLFLALSSYINYVVDIDNKSGAIPDARCLDNKSGVIPDARCLGNKNRGGESDFLSINEESACIKGQNTSGVRTFLSICKDNNCGKVHSEKSVLSKSTDIYNKSRVTSVPLMLFLGFARLGCYFNGCCYAVIIGREVPLNLLESGLAFAGAAFVWVGAVKRPLWLLTAYSVFRFFTDFFKTSFVFENIWKITPFQFLYAAVAAISAAVVIISGLKRRKVYGQT